MTCSRIRQSKIPRIGVERSEIPQRGKFGPMESPNFGKFGYIRQSKSNSALIQGVKK
jgi:hypothetical protein